METINIGILGLGTVGSGVVQIYKVTQIKSQALLAES